VRTPATLVRDEAVNGSTDNATSRGKACTQAGACHVEGISSFWLRSDPSAYIA
jgi:hypothetical protein